MPLFTFARAAKPLWKYRAVDTLPLPVEIIRLRQGRHLLWTFTKQPPRRSTLPLKPHAESALPLPVGIIRLRQGKRLLWLLTNQLPRCSTLLLKPHADSTLPLPVGIIHLRQGRHLLLLLTNLSPYRRTPLLKIRGYAPYRHWPGLSASARASACSGRSPSSPLAAALCP